VTVLRSVAGVNDMLGLHGDGGGLARQLLFTIEQRDTLPFRPWPLRWRCSPSSSDANGSPQRVPGALIAVVGVIVASASFHWERTSIAIVGAVPAALPHLGIPRPSLAHVMMIVPIAFSCFVVVIA
jgi:Sulfate permease family